MNKDELAKTKIDEVKIEGVIDMKASPAEVAEFMKSFDAWLGRSKWRFKGSMGVSPVGRTPRKGLLSGGKFTAILAGFLAVQGIKQVVVFANGGERWIGILAVVMLWYSGVMFERTFNR